MSENKPVVGVIMGSQSDWGVMKETTKVLELLEIACEAKIISAHRTPKRLSDYVEGAEARGVKIIIAGAGGAAHLAGVTAALTTLPVLGVPMESQALKGMDSLLSIVQMPGGIPVGTLAIGKAGAKNAGLLAAAIIALMDEGVAERLSSWREQQSQSIAYEPVDQ